MHLQSSSQGASCPSVSDSPCRPMACFLWTSFTRDHEILCAAWGFRASQRQGCSWTALVVPTMFQPTTSTFFSSLESSRDSFPDEASMATESCSISQTPSLAHAAPTAQLIAQDFSKEQAAQTQPLTPSQLHLSFQSSLCFPNKLAELATTKISSYAFLTQLILWCLPE